MHFATQFKDRADEIVTLFETTFAASEGDADGQLIGQLVRTMLANVPSDDIYVVSAEEDGIIVGSVIFTRMSFAQDDRTVFILSPAAVTPNQQGRGLGQELLRNGLNGLREHGVDIVLTYGDINFYSKVGFAHLSVVEVPPPLPLQYPEGWLGLSLTEHPLGILSGPSACVEPLSNPDLW